MSSILKALKKLEDENNARTPDSLKINAEILRGGNSSRHSSLGILSTALLLFLCGGVVMYFFMKPDGKKPVTASSPAPVESTLPGASVPVAPILQPTQSTPVITLRHSPAASDKHTSAAVKAGINKPLLQMNAAKHPLAPATSRRGEQAESPIVPARPLVRVNGIAYQDGSDSVAVINNVAVSRGAVIEGIKVEEIQRDRVLFSYGGEKFEVSLGKSNQ